jgi:hypothetical protein
MREEDGNEGREIIFKNVKLIHTPSSEWKGIGDRIKREGGREGGEGMGV